MSTRAQIAVKDESSVQLLYQHSDGYPEGVLPMLQGFVAAIRDGSIRDNVGQSAGWLIVWGHNELEAGLEEQRTAFADSNAVLKDIMGRKASYIEPAPEGLHGDIEYLYVVDLKARKVMYSDMISEILDLQDRMFGHQANPNVLIPVLMELSLWNFPDI